jgi:hypothetical protein
VDLGGAQHRRQGQMTLAHFARAACELSSPVRARLIPMDTGGLLLHEFVPVQTAAGTVLVKAVVEDSLDGPSDVSDSEERMTELLGTVRSVAQDLLVTLDNLNLSKITAEFGVQFVAKSGKLLSAFVDAGGECAFKVTLEWSQQSA